MLVYSQDDVEWISAVERIFNPKKFHPDDVLKEKIEESWDDAISCFVLQDLRRSIFRGGRRTHLWAEMSCMIAYFLTPLPSLCSLINFGCISDADSLKFGPKFFLQFVSNATCIFYPQYSSFNSLKAKDFSPAPASGTDRFTRSLRTRPGRESVLSGNSTDTDNLSRKNASRFSSSSGLTFSGSQGSTSRFSLFHGDKYSMISAFTSYTESSIQGPPESPKHGKPTPFQFYGLAHPASPALYASYCPGHREPLRLRPQYPAHPSVQFNLLPANLKVFCPSRRDPSREWFTPGSKWKKEINVNHVPYRRPLTPDPPHRDPLSPSFTTFWPSRRMIPPIIPIPIFEENDATLAAFNREQDVIVTAEQKSRLKSFLKLLRRGTGSPTRSHEVPKLHPS